MIQVLVQKVSRESLSTVNEAIVHVIDVELTRETKTLQVRVGCDEELDRLKVRTSLIQNPLLPRPSDNLASVAWHRHNSTSWKSFSHKRPANC